MAGRLWGAVLYASLAGGSSGFPARASSAPEAQGWGGNGALGCCSCVPSLCLTSCLLPLLAGSEYSSRHSVVGLEIGEGAPDKLNLSTGVQAGSHPWQPLLAQKAAKERVCGRKETVEHNEDESGILLGSSTHAPLLSPCPLTYFITPQNHLKRFVNNAFFGLTPTPDSDLVHLGPARNMLFFF